jgi:hypothetical protein
MVPRGTAANYLRWKSHRAGAGKLSVIRRRQAVSDFVEHTRRQLTDLFRPYDPGHAQPQSAQSV